MKRVPLAIRVAATITVAALAACGGGGGDAPSTTPVAGTPSPGAAPAPAPALAPAAASLVGNPITGKALFSSIPGSGQACIDCHLSVDDVRGRAKTEAGYQAMILYAIYGNTPQQDMANALRGKLSETQIWDIAAYLKSGNP